MTYRVDLTERAVRDLRRIYQDINAESAAQARDWFNGLEKAIFGLGEYPARGAPIPEDGDLRHLLYGRKGHRYRIIYTSLLQNSGAAGGEFLLGPSTLGNI